MPEFTGVGLGGLMLACAWGAAALWQVRRARRMQRRRQVQPLRDALHRMRPPAGATLVERYALGYLQVDALLIEGAERHGCSTRKIGGLARAPVELDSWSLARDLLLRGVIGVRTYAIYTLCRRTWVHLLAGRHARLAIRHVRRCEQLVERLNYTLGVPAAAVRERVSARLAAAGVELAD